MPDSIYMEIVVQEGEPPKWMADLEEREIDEVSHAIVYSELYHHGTTGHMALMLIAKLARKLNAMEGYGSLVSVETEVQVEEPVVEPADEAVHIYHPLSDRKEGVPGDTAS